MIRDSIAYMTLGSLLIGSQIHLMVRITRGRQNYDGTWQFVADVARSHVGQGQNVPHLTKQLAVKDVYGIVDRSIYNNRMEKSLSYTLIIAGCILVIGYIPE
jgi:hypothetical protein